MMKLHFSPLKMRFSRCAVVCLVAFSAIASLSAQAPASAVEEEFSYTMILEGGTNASAVAWDGKKEVYVTVIAGNESFPMEVFDGKGDAVFQLDAGFDWRGLWYNPATGMLEGNGAGKYGWATFSLGDADSRSEIDNFEASQCQPDFNSVGAYDAVKRQVVYLDFTVDGLAMYARKNAMKIKYLSLDWSNADLGQVNTTTVGCTGHKNYEFVLLDYSFGKLLFFNRSGDQTASVQLPVGSPLEEQFAFSFAHDRAFLYDKTSRVWHAYKVW
jgi:hypothetical protein